MPISKLNKITRIVASQVKPTDLWKILFLFVILSFLELIGLGLIVPLFKSLLDLNQKSEIIFLLKNLGVNANKDNIVIMLSIFILIIYAAKTLMSISTNFKIIKFSQEFKASFSSYLLKNYLLQDYEKYLSRNSSEYIYNIQILTSRFSSFLLQIIRTISETMVAFLLIIFLAYQSLELLLFLAGVFTIFILLYDKFLKKRISRYGEKVNKTNLTIIQTINESLNSIESVKVFEKEQMFISRLDSNAFDNAIHSSWLQIFNLMSRYIAEFLLVLLIVFTLLLSAFLNQSYVNILPVLVVFGVASLKIIPSINRISNTITQYRESTNTVNRLYSDLDINHSRKREKNKNHLRVFEKIEFANISFNYKGSRKKILDNINLEIKQGQIIGIIGPSGSGKSTLVNLILGLLKPTNGEIKLNEINTKNSKRSLIGLAAYIPQSVFMIDDTLRNNIVLSDDSSICDKKRLTEVISLSRLNEFIQELPNGLDTVIGERGVKLSGGQKQRVAIARALYHKMDFLVMDEATSALDSKTEQEVMCQIRRIKKGKTIIMIAHRLSTLKDCDIIYEVINGKVKKVNP